MASGKIEVVGRAAVVSPDQRYRYTLERHMLRGAGTVMFVMLNPSTADHETDDPTIRRCIGFADSWNCSVLLVGNLFAYRATDPKELPQTSVGVGVNNDAHLTYMAARADVVVCAWGGEAKAWRRNEVWQLLRRYKGDALYCLGQTKDGSPRHPLYIKKDQLLVPFKV